jgi:hypothetical protein
MTVRSHFASTGPGVQAGRPFTPRLITTVIGAGILSLTACAPRQAPSGLPGGVQAAPAVVAAASADLAITVPVEAARYTIQTTAQVLISADSMTRADTLASVSLVRATPQGTAYLVLVDSHTVSGAGLPARTIARDVRTVARYAASNGWEFVGLGDPCATPAATVAEATRDLWVRWPTRVRRGSEWRDTSRSTLCRDGIPLTAITERSYRIDAVPDRENAPVIVTRRSVVTITGRGLLRSDPTEIIGQSNGTARLYLDAATGWLDSLRGDAVLSMDVRGSTRTQRITQQSQSHLQRAPRLP